ncbi:DUF3800 domain-containing protein [Deinococcus kurensis]|uniref:DUF3800 domain-containing protein n=1 Tax=Deinococcus kurensis TaxID=2662757 RepID=UPI0012D32CE4|nr:DUF3800 domain-containing protein [Deinococcus kurensis]
MYLIYVDDYGHTGADLSNKQQPIYMLFALIVSEEQWAILEPSLWGLITEIADKTGQDLEGFELHAKDFFNGRNKTYRSLTFEEKVDYMDRVVQLVKILGCKCLATFVVKEPLQNLRERQASLKAAGDLDRALKDTTLAGLLPHPLAFSRLLGEIDSFCQKEGQNAIIVLDHQEEYVESRQLHSHMLYRNTIPLETSRILDMPFDGDGRYNILLQISDLLGYVYGRHLQHRLLQKNISEELNEVAVRMGPIVTSINAFENLVLEKLPFTWAMFAEYGMRDNKRDYPANVRVANITALLSTEDDVTDDINKKGQGVLE